MHVYLKRGQKILLSGGFIPTFIYFYLNVWSRISAHTSTFTLLLYDAELILIQQVIYFYRIFTFI